MEASDDCVEFRVAKHAATILLKKLSQLLNVIDCEIWEKSSAIVGKQVDAGMSHQQIVQIINVGRLIKRRLEKVAESFDKLIELDSVALSVAFVLGSREVLLRVAHLVRQVPHLLIQRGEHQRVNLH